MTKTCNTSSPLHRKSKLAKSLERDVLGIALEHGRRVGSEGHTIVEEYLLERLDEIGCEPYAGDSFSLPYLQDGELFTNIVGVIPGKDRSKQPLLIGAHYDSVIDAPCADDNAAADQQQEEEAAAASSSHSQAGSSDDAAPGPPRTLLQEDDIRRKRKQV